VNECSICIGQTYQDQTRQNECKKVTECAKPELEWINGEHLRTRQTRDEGRCRPCSVGGSHPKAGKDTKIANSEHVFGEYRPAQKCYLQIGHTGSGNPCDGTGGLSYEQSPDQLVSEGEGASHSTDWRTQNWNQAYGDLMGLKRGLNGRKEMELIERLNTQMNEIGCNIECAKRSNCKMFAVLVAAGQDAERSKPGYCHLYGPETGVVRSKRCWSASWRGQAIECDVGSESWAGSFGSASACADHCGRTSADGGKNMNPDTRWFGLIWKNPWYGSGSCYCENYARGSYSYFGSYRCWSETSNSYSMYAMTEYVHYNSVCQKAYYPYRFPCYE